jgi:hypothetical protein
MIGQQRPGETSCTGLEQEIGEPVKEILAICVIPKNLSAFNSADDNVVKGAGGIYSGFSRHGRKCSRSDSGGKA